MFVQSNSYSGEGGTRFSCVRYGNVLGSRGSVIPLFMKQRSNGKVTITDSRMTRFFITLQQGVDFVIRCCSNMKGGEVFVPKIPSTSIIELAKAVAPDCEIEEIGIGSGEKLHETLISEDESRNAVELKDMFLIKPAHAWWTDDGRDEGEKLSDGFRYTSDNQEKLNSEELAQLLESAGLMAVREDDYSYPRIPS